MNILRTLLADATVSGFTLRVGAEGEIDYEGRNVSDALDAIEACDEIDLHLIDSDGEVEVWVGIINDADGCEKFWNFSGGWMDRWYEENA